MTEIAVIGAGQMGAGIAQVAAQSECRVWLLDADLKRAQAGCARIAAQWDRLVNKSKMDPGARDACVERLGALAGLDDLQGKPLAFVIEAASENQTIKEGIFAQLDRVCAPDTILASNTSSISITALAAQTARPDKVIGVHFMNPVPVMKLVEVIRGLPTSDDTHDKALVLVQKMGKESVVSRDVPGFIVNRILMPMINEACFALYENIASANDIDQAIRLGLNHPMGPLALADLIGLDTTLSILQVLHNDFGDDKYRPCVLLKQYVAAGWLGRKSGRGFFQYPSR